MIDELKEVRDTLDFLEDCLCNRVPREAAREAITTLDRIINQDEVELVGKVAEKAGLTDERAKASLRAIGLIGGE